ASGTWRSIGSFAAGAAHVRARTAEPSAPLTSVTPGAQASEHPPRPAERAPAGRAHQKTALRLQTRAGRASSGAQMLILRVSGIRNRASTNMIAGSPMGYASAQPRLPVDRYAEVVMIGTRPPPQPLPM